SSFSSIDRKKLIEMRKLFENCREDIKEGKIEQFIKLDEEFHRFIVTSSENQRLIKIMENLDDQIRLARLKSFSVPGRVEKALEEHLEIIDIILAADLEKAEKIILKHSENAKQNILKFLEKKNKKGEKNAGKEVNS
ncbi:FCD domain-containing protein, partial [Candidatus Aerophobetes bacterium]|nr:FCD domain-containing protein [Candidatus Aerophobetes bacterium]